MGYDFRDKVAVVTGASSGIGRATALALAREGATVVLAGRSLEGLAKTEENIRAAGGRAWSLQTDVADAAQAEALVSETVRREGRIDVLVANAGQYHRQPVRELSVEVLERIMAVNFYGSIRPILAALPGMIARGAGHIVAVSSLDGKKGVPPDGAYVASKFALTGLCEVLRQELRGTGVFVSTVFPGRIDTPMIDTLDVPAISAKSPPEHVARAILRGIRRRTPEIIVPFASGKLLIVVSAMSAALSDFLIRVLGLGGRDRASRHAQTS